MAGRDPRLRRDVPAGPEARRFDVFQGLILAIDAKDRYTKRHSEDVSRYAMFLAGRSASTRADRDDPAGRAAPRRRQDRHPGRDPPQARPADRRRVRRRQAARRPRRPHRPRPARPRRHPGRDPHHHERWDGRATSRPRGRGDPARRSDPGGGRRLLGHDHDPAYRKALAVEEALLRLGDAAGTQLDERLVARSSRDRDARTRRAPEYYFQDPAVAAGAPRRLIVVRGSRMAGAVGARHRRNLAASGSGRGGLPMGDHRITGAIPANKDATVEFTVTNLGHPAGSGARMRPGVDPGSLRPQGSEAVAVPSGKHWKTGQSGGTGSSRVAEYRAEQDNDELARRTRPRYSKSR